MEPKNFKKLQDKKESFLFLFLFFSFLKNKKKVLILVTSGIATILEKGAKSRKEQKRERRTNTINY